MVCTYSSDGFHSYCEQLHNDQQPCLKQVAEAMISMLTHNRITQQLSVADSFLLNTREVKELNITSLIQEALEDIVTYIEDQIGLGDNDDVKR